MAPASSALQDAPPVGERGERHDARLRQPRQQLAGCLDPVRRPASRGPSGRRRGELRRRSSTASSPLAAAPTTEMPSAPSSRSERPARTTAWSSAISTRIMQPAPPARIVVPAPGLDSMVELPPASRGEVAHQPQPEVPPRRRPRGRSGSNPRPSSSTASSRRPAASPTAIAMCEASPWRTALRTLSWAMRKSRAWVSRRRGRSRRRCPGSWPPHGPPPGPAGPRAPARARPPAAKPGRSRPAGCAARARSGASGPSPRAGRSRRRRVLRRVEALGGGGQRERGSGQLLHHAIVKVGGDAPPLAAPSVEGPLQERLALAMAAAQATSHRGGERHVHELKQDERSQSAPARRRARCPSRSPRLS